MLYIIKSHREAWKRMKNNSEIAKEYINSKISHFKWKMSPKKKRMGRKSEKKDAKSCSRASPNGFYSLTRIQLSQNVETFYSFNFKMRYEWKIKSFVRDFRWEWDFSKLFILLISFSLMFLCWKSENLFCCCL